MSRNRNKGPYVVKHLLKKISLFQNKGTKEVIKTWSRDSTIIPSMIGHTLEVYNGKKHIRIFVTDQIVGHKLGEFSFTRKFISHKKSEKKVVRKTITK